MLFYFARADFFFFGIFDIFFCLFCFEYFSLGRDSYCTAELPLASFPIPPFL